MARSPQELKSRLLHALASPVRIRIVELLRASGSMTVSEIHQRLGIEPANASQHLAVLRERGVVTRRREGTSNWYAIADPRLHDLLDDVAAIVARQTDEDARALSPRPADPGRAGTPGATRGRRPA